MPFDRFYGSIRPQRLECPRCGQIVQFAMGRPHERSYSELTSRLMCPNCQSVYVVGWLLWSPARNASKVRRTPPDTKLTRRQLARLRNEAGGFWATEPYEVGDPVHKYLEIPPELVDPDSDEDDDT